jgi:hypothetical protein
METLGGGREPASFEEFQAIRRRNREGAASKKGRGGGSGGGGSSASSSLAEGTGGAADGGGIESRTAARRNRRKEERAAAAAEGAAAGARGAASRTLRQRLGALAEAPEVQVLVVILVVFDWVAAVLQMLVAAGALGDAEGLRNVARFLDYASAFTLLAFVLEMVLLLVSFGASIVDHIGYTLDVAVVGLSVYIQLSYGSLAVRLLGALRLWRVARILSSVVAAQEEAHRLTKEELEEELQRCEDTEAARQALEAALAREAASRRRVEEMLASYKEEVDTLREALQIAAVSVAEAEAVGAGAGALTPPPGGAGARSAGRRTGTPSSAPAPTSKIVVGADGSLTRM